MQAFRDQLANLNQQLQQAQLNANGNERRLDELGLTPVVP
jgi:hypothetical protein